jgi:hypothetical protein
VSERTPGILEVLNAQLGAAEVRGLVLVGGLNSVEGLCGIVLLATLVVWLDPALQSGILSLHRA